MTKARFLSSALDGQTVTMSATQGGVTVGPNTISAWKQTDNPWQGPGPATLTLDVQEILPSQGTFAPYPVEWRIRVASGLSYSTPDWAPAFADPYHTSLGAGDEDTIRLAIQADDPSCQRCQFVVHTGDTGNYRNDWVGSQAHRLKSREYGQNPGHVYSEPGTYAERSVYVYDDEGNWGTASLPDLVVFAPDASFDAASTIVVSPTSDWTDAPPHDVANRCSTVQQASARFDAIKNSVTAGVRICLQAGQTYNERADQMDTRDAKGVCLFDTYGSAGQAIYTEANTDVTVVGDHLFRIDENAWAWRIKGVKFDMGYDLINGRPTNPDGWLGQRKTTSRGFMLVTFPAAIYDAVLQTDPAARIVYDNLDVTGCAWFSTTQLNGPEVEGRNVAFFVNDCDMYGNAEYAFLTPINMFSMGSKYRALPDADLGGMGRSMALGTSRGWAGHPIFLREQRAWTVYVRACWVESRGGWSGEPSNTVWRGGQPVMRLANRGSGAVINDPSGWLDGRGKRVFICDSVLTGYFGLDIDGDITNSGDPLGGSHSIVENCLIFTEPMTGSDTGSILDFGPRCSVRNCMFLTTSGPPYRLNTMAGRNEDDRMDKDDSRFGRFKQFITNDKLNTFKDGGIVENRHNTFVHLRTTANTEDLTFAPRGDPNEGTVWDPANQTMLEGHNITHAPNLDTPIIVAMDTIDLPAGMRILDPHIRFTWENVKVFNATTDVPDGGISEPIQYPADWYLNPTTGSDYDESAGNNSLETGDEELNDGTLELPYREIVNAFMVGETVTDDVTSATATILGVKVNTANTTKGSLVITAVTPGTGGQLFLQNNPISSLSASAVAESIADKQRLFEPDDQYPNFSGSQAVQATNAGRMRVIHDCNAAGVVQGDGSGTHCRIENLSGWEWKAGTWRLVLDRGSTGMVPDRPDTPGSSLVAVDQSEFKLYRPTTPQPLDGGLGSTLWDFNRALRPGAGYAISPTSGVNAAGALLPA